MVPTFATHWEKTYNYNLALKEIPDNKGINFLAQLYTGDPKRYKPARPFIIFFLA